MRETLFRGKRTNKGEWLYGSFICVKHWKTDNVLYKIIPFEYEGINNEVIPETVGEYTGLLDRNGKKIFEGDIVQCLMLGYTYKHEYMKGAVVFADGCFEVCFQGSFEERTTGTVYQRSRSYVKSFVVNHALENIGNVHDNPELLEAANAQ